MNSESKLEELKEEFKINPEKLSLCLENFIREHVQKLERQGVIIGLSGGLDSAVVAVLCKKAVGAEKTLALVMPEKNSERKHFKDALNFAKELEIETRVIDITPYLEKLGIYELFPLNKIPLPKKLKGALTRKAYNLYVRKTGETPFLVSLSGFKDKEFESYLKEANAYYRIKHRMRMMLLYLYGEIENRLVVGSANKSEYKTGFFVKHGCDDAADIMPLLHLYKTQIRELARYLDIPSKILGKLPSPDIIPGITDEKAIGISYEKLDLILLALEKGWENSKIVKVLGIGWKWVAYVNDLIKKSEHMRKVYVPDRFG